jgi:hypothetical protein
VRLNETWSRQESAEKTSWNSRFTQSKGIQTKNNEKKLRQKKYQNMTYTLSKEETVNRNRSRNCPDIVDKVNNIEEQTTEEQNENASNKKQEMKNF